MKSGTPGPKLLFTAWALAMGSLVLATASLAGNGDGLPGFTGTAGLGALAAVVVLLGLLWGLLASRAGGRPARAGSHR